jgi:hypothetical protein
MAARYDKYDPFSGGFRAPLNADWLDADVGIPFGVGLNASGKVVKGAGQTGVRGVLVVDAKGRKANDIVDVMTNGEIVDITSPALVAGQKYGGVAATGVIGAAGAGAGSEVGFTVEATRLIVRCNGGATT